MSGEREGGAFQKPSHQSGVKSVGKPFAKPDGSFRNKSDDLSGGRPEGSGVLRPWKAPQADAADFPTPSAHEERQGETDPAADNPHAGKFYERYANRPKGKRPEQSEVREERASSRPERSLQSSERPQRIPSSTNARSFDDRRDRQPYREQRNPGAQDYGPARPERPFDSRRDADRRPSGGYDSGGRRDAYPQRDTRSYDDRRDQPSNRDQRDTRSPSYDQRRPEGSFDPRREADRRPSGYDSGARRDEYPPRNTRSYDDRREDRRDPPPYREQRNPSPPNYGPAHTERPYDSRREPERRSSSGYDSGGRREGYQQRDTRNYDDRRDDRRTPDRPAPHLEHRIIRSEGAKADQRPTPSARPEMEGPLCAAREIAAEVLLRRLQGNNFVEDLLDEAFLSTKMRPDDRRLAQEMVYGCVRWQATLDWLIARKTEDRPQLPQVQVFLRLGLYQLFFLDRIPPHAACFETVEIAKRLGFVQQSNFINAILRRLDAERATVKQSLAELQTTHPHLGYSHPEWLVQKWTARWGAEDTRRLLEWNNTPPPTNIRVNTLKTDSTKLIERWRLHESVEYDFLTCPWVEEHTVFTLKTHPSLASLDSFREGWFYVQDPSTLLAVQALDAWAGESILDLCAAPGGKTAYIAQKMENDGELLACDSSPDRLKLVTENCARLGVTCVKTVALGDHPEAVLQFQKFDKVLVDAPCSNTGVLRRRLDLRWRLQPEEPARLRETQLKLLHLASLHLKPDGTLVYSTCSLEPEENSEVVKDFLATHPQFRLESERDLLPFRDGVDGAYVAKLRS